MKPTSGKVVAGVTVKPALLAQEITSIDPTLRVLKAVEEIKSSIDIGKGRVLTAGQLLERFGFTGEKQWTPVGDLSGGERRRLQVLRLLMAEPNVLLFDEPTNDLDIDTLNALEDILDSWPGSMIVVSHDRFFLERTTDRIAALMGDGKLRMLPGGVDEYLERRRSAVPTQSPVQPASSQQGGGGGQPVSSSQAQRAAQKEQTRIERQLDKVAAKEKELHARMAEAGADYSVIGSLDAELRTLAAERERLEEQWLELTDD